MSDSHDRFGHILDWETQKKTMFFLCHANILSAYTCWMHGAGWLRLFYTPLLKKHLVELTGDTDKMANLHETPPAYLSMHSSTWINHHSGTSEKLNFISFLVLCHYGSFVNLDRLTYIIIFSFKVDSQHQRDNIGFEVPRDWITV